MKQHPTTIFLAIVLFLSSLGHAQNEREKLQVGEISKATGPEVTFLEESPVIDGMLDEDLESLPVRILPLVSKRKLDPFAPVEFRLAYGVSFFYLCIEADINLDMIGRTDKASESERAHYALDTDNVRPEFKKLIMEVKERTIRWPLKYDIQPDNGSDNFIFELMSKIPTVFFYSGHHPDRHQPTDDVDKIDYEKAEKISPLGYEIINELATRT